MVFSINTFLDKTITSLPFLGTGGTLPLAKGITQYASSGLSEDSYVECDFEDDETNYSVEELQTQKNELTSEKSTAQTELSEINSGEAEELSEAKQTMEDAYQQYQNSMSQDAEDNPELFALMEQEDTLKADLETNSIEIAGKKADIAAKDNEIAEQNTTISGFQSELSTLESQLSSIPADSTEEGSEEANAALQAQRESIQHLIDLKKEEISLAQDKLLRLETEAETLNNELISLETTKSELEAQEKETQTAIQDLSSELTKQYQEKYNSAKEAYETAKTTMADNTQNEIDTYESEIRQLEKKITEARNLEYENGNYEPTGQDVIDYAKQYEGLNGNDMSEIMSSQGYQFDEGVWCADFVTFVMEKVYGENDTPDDFSNTCEYTCRCSSIVEWGDNNGRTTGDSSQVKAGDVVIINTTTGTGSGLHVAIVESVNEDGSINTVEGNTIDDLGNYSMEDENGNYLWEGTVNERTRSADEVNTYVIMQK